MKIVEFTEIDGYGVKDREGYFYSKEGDRYISEEFVRRKCAHSASEAINLYSRLYKEQYYKPISCKEIELKDLIKRLQEGKEL